MSYNVNIPAGTDPILKSARQIKANFQAINAAFADNHIKLTEDPSIAGMHRFLTMRNQALDPVTSATQVALYNKLVSTIPQLFFRPNNNQTPIQLTINTIKADLTDTQYTFIAGPMIIYAGKVVMVSNPQTVNLSPGSSLIFIDLVMTVKRNLVATISYEATPVNIIGTSFDISFPTAVVTANVDVYYFAVGLL